jgi:hypothetical protein
MEQAQRAVDAFAQEGAPALWSSARSTVPTRPLGPRCRLSRKQQSRSDLSFAWKAAGTASWLLLRKRSIPRSLMLAALPARRR